MCPIHHFTSSPFCRYCTAFAGGFVGGFVTAPWRWYSGGKRMTSMGGILLAQKGRQEEEENRFIGQQIRAVCGLPLRSMFQNMGHALDAWALLPRETRTRLVESGFGAIGSFGGSLVASQVALFSLSYLGGRFVALHPRLRPLTLVRHPAMIGAGVILSVLSLQGSFALLIERQQQIFTQFSGSEAIYRDVLDEATKDKDEDGKS